MINSSMLLGFFCFLSLFGGLAMILASTISKSKNRVWTLLGGCALCFAAILTMVISFISGTWS